MLTTLEMAGVLYTSLFTVQVETKKHTRKHKEKIEKEHKNTYLTKIIKLSNS